MENMSSKEIIQFLIHARVGRIGISLEEYPYVVPVGYVYSDDKIYFHTCESGMKIEGMKKNPNVCFELDIDTKLIKAEKPCDWGMRYKSVVGFGKAELVEDIELEREGVDIIMQQYSQATFEYPQRAIANITIIKVAIESMTGKVSG